MLEWDPEEGYRDHHQQVQGGQGRKEERQGQDWIRQDDRQFHCGSDASVVCHASGSDEWIRCNSGEAMPEHDGLCDRACVDDSGAQCIVLCRHP